MKHELTGQALPKSVIEETLTELPKESKTHHTELVRKLGPGVDHYFDVFGLAPEIYKKAGRAQLKEIYEKLIDLMYSNLEFIPEHRENQTVEVIEDFHHHYKGSLGDETDQVTIPAQWSLTNKGSREVCKFELELRRDYDPAMRECGLRRIFRRRKK